MSRCIGLPAVELALVLFSPLPRHGLYPKIVGSHGHNHQQDDPDQQPQAVALVPAFLLVVAAQALGFCGGYGLNAVLHRPWAPQGAPVAPQAAQGGVAESPAL